LNEQETFFPLLSFIIPVTTNLEFAWRIGYGSHKEGTDKYKDVGSWKLEQGWNGQVGRSGRWFTAVEGRESSVTSS